MIHYPASTTTTAATTQADETADDDDDDDDDEDDDEKEEGAARRRKILTLPTSSTGLAGSISAQTLCQLREIRRTRIRTNRANNTTTPKKKRIKVVLISGMRTTTFFQRLPYLPKADAYCTENGGRIFYPCTTTMTTGILRWVQPEHFQGCEEEDVTPFGIREDTVWKERMRHALHGAKNSPPPTRTSETTMTRTTPPNPGDHHDVLSPEAEKETFHKEGVFWDFARDLVQNKHFVVDTTGYSTCFRVNRKQQQQQRQRTTLPPQPPTPEFHSTTNPSSSSSYPFDDLYNGKLFDHTDRLHTQHIASSMNMKCVDFYPAMSGKKNWYVLFLDDEIECILFLAFSTEVSYSPIISADLFLFLPQYQSSSSSKRPHNTSCLYLAAKFFPERCGRTVDTNNTNDDLLAASKTQTTNKHEGTNIGTAASSSAVEFVSHHALCLCDDDNDVEMALACHHAYLPDIASQSMRETIRHYPRHFTSIPVWKEEEDNNHTTAHDWSNTITSTTSSSRKSSSSSGSRDPIIQRGTTDATELLLSMIMERLGTNNNDDA